ncbi:MAG: hypothetical protein GQ537_01595 [Gammaproteobacteria bacterium]|nr:hypothetical protein [Gammaproteobacteria bacterium]
MNIFRAISKRFQRKQEFHYASVTSRGICNAVFRMDVPVGGAHIIPISGRDATLIGKRWIGTRWVG